MLLVAWAAGAQAASSEWQFDEWAGPPVPVRLYVPDEGSEAAPVVVVMHGASRDAPRYFSDWQKAAEEFGFIIVVPYFSKADFKGSARYNLGHVFEAGGGNRRPQGEWTFAAIEPLFDAVVERTGSRATSYTLYGHSAGSQFVHRFLYYLPDARVDHYIAANAGWYTLPVGEFDYPYGLAGSGIGDAEVTRILQQPLTLLVGSEDRDPDASSLRKTPEAMQQGPHRLARGLTMYRIAKQRAKELDVRLNWQLFVVKDADHDNAKMVPMAAALIVETPQK